MEIEEKTGDGVSGVEGGAIGHHRRWQVNLGHGLGDPPWADLISALMFHSLLPFTS